LRVDLRGTRQREDSQSRYEEDDTSAEQRPIMNEAACFHDFTLS
jgi:hypothetical protein